MNRTSKLSTGNSVPRLGDTQPTLSFMSPHKASDDKLNSLSRMGIQRLIAREEYRKRSQQIKDETDVEMHCTRLTLQAKVLITGETIAHNTALARQSISADCSKVTANGIERLEHERYGRTKDCVLKHSSEEKELEKLVNSGALTEEQAEFLRSESMDRTNTLIAGDKAMTRQFSDCLRRFSLIAVTGFKGSQSEDEQA